MTHSCPGLTSIVTSFSVIAPAAAVLYHEAEIPFSCSDAAIAISWSDLRSMHADLSVTSSRSRNSWNAETICVLIYYSVQKISVN